MQIIQFHTVWLFFPSAHPYDNGLVKTIPVKNYFFPDQPKKSNTNHSKKP